eukprot:CAMPEP_0184553212 /NCGR_PEP_ID=MMETSP0199_2-20130426/31311_1 /TAXON_ID=1112570 /ORGANISM="Thraustochytrium sp., Strain LLF1b" /LENGTH=599 /DNA_ID=CAMNT_0026948901 /DNA_START=170 /DNA_END=1969 /DNA_ORIENTATION=-
MDETTLALGGLVAGLVLCVVWLVFRRSDPVLKEVEVPLHPFEQKDVIDAPVKESMELVLPDRPGKLQCYDPCTMQHLGEVEMMTKSRVDEVVAKARSAQKQWATSTFGERRAVLRAIQDYYLRHAEDICRVCCRDTGKTLLGAMLGEITPTCEKIRWMIQNGEAILKPEYRGGGGLMTIHKSARVEYEPLGVLGVLAPFNYVGHNLLNHIVSGIFSGNGVVCKVSEFTSWSADYLLRPVRQALENAGYSGELVQIVTGMAEAGAALTESAVDKVIFTGSDRVGRLVMQGAAKRLTPVVLELGGKDPFIVCDDVDLGSVMPTALRGVFQNCGQNCIGIERIFVHESLHDRFVEMAFEKVSQMRQGVPLVEASKGGVVDVGAMTMPTALDAIQALVDDAVCLGAKLVIGGKRNAALAPGQFYMPTILTGITSKMRIAQEEVFGPVMAIRSWRTEEDLIEAVNDCNYALGSSIFSRDTKRANRIAKKVRAGMANINDFGINYLCQSLPFGGRGCSGFDKFAGPEGLRACCLVKAVTDDKFPGVHTSLPGPFQYPTSVDSHVVAKHLLGLAYNPAWAARLSALIRMLKGIIAPVRSAAKPKTA